MGCARSTAFSWSLDTPCSVLPEISEIAVTGHGHRTETKMKTTRPTYILESGSRPSADASHPQSLNLPFLPAPFANVRSKLSAMHVIPEASSCPYLPALSAQTR